MTWTWQSVAPAGISNDGAVALVALVLSLVALVVVAVALLN